MNEQKLIERLRLIESLFSGASTEGERVAAERAKERILERLASMVEEEPPVEYKFTMADHYSRRVLLALCRRYGLEPYRYHGQRHTTVMVRVSKRFVDETLWPEFKELSETLRAYLSEVTDRVVAEVLHEDRSEASVVEEGGQLPTPSSGASTSSTSAPETSGSSTSPGGETASSDDSTSTQQDRGKKSRRDKRRDKKRKKKRRRK